VVAGEARPEESERVAGAEKVVQRRGIVERPRRPAAADQLEEREGRVVLIRVLVANVEREVEERGQRHERRALEPTGR